MKTASYSVEGETVRLIDEKSEIAIPLSWVREIRTIADPEPTVTVAQIAAVEVNLDNDFEYSDLVVSLSKKHQVDWKLVVAVMKAESIEYRGRSVLPHHLRRDARSNRPLKRVLLTGSTCRFRARTRIDVGGPHATLRCRQRRPDALWRGIAIRLTIPGDLPALTGLPHAVA